jgi:4-hydroxy-tetrahydrodipicolinate synthase
MSPAPQSLRGSIVPLVTPFSGGAIDVEAFEASVERVGVASDGIVVTGTSGEPTSLTAGERADLYRRAVAVAAGRFPVVAATGSPNQAETIALTQEAEATGVDAVMVVCPAFVKPSQEGLRRHFITVAGATGLPLLIYNIPGRSGVGVTGATVEAIVAEAPNVVGLKHASNDLDLVTDLLLRLGEDFRLFCGLESYSYPFLAVGGAGLMNAVGNLLPAAFTELCTLVAAGDHVPALRLHRELFRLNEAVFFDTNPGPLKAMMADAGLGSAEVRPPLAPPSDEVRARALGVARACPLYQGGRTEVAA